MQRTLGDGARAVLTSLLLETFGLGEFLALRMEVHGLAIAKHALLAESCASNSSRGLLLQTYCYEQFRLTEDNEPLLQEYYPARYRAQQNHCWSCGSTKERRGLAKRPSCRISS